MKFSWKLCFATISISLIILSVGGYVLISALFQSTYEREIENALEENQMLQYSFLAHWNMYVRDFDLTKENVVKVVEAMRQNLQGSRIRVSDEEQFVIADYANAAIDRGLLDSINAETRGYRLRKNQSGYELQTASILCVKDEQFLYLESIRDVTGIFRERDRQYNIYRLWMLGILLLESISCVCMAMWMLRPLKHLSETVGEIARGNLSVRANVLTKDEFGELANSFNEMAENLERQVHELEEASRRQKDFIGSFAHELKTPMTSMIGYADMLRSRELSEEECLEAANYIFKEGKRLETLSQKLLELLVVQKGTLEKKWVPAKWLAKEVEDILKPSMQKGGVELEVMVEDATLFLEPDLIKTVLLNLLDNGRKAMEGNGRLALMGSVEEDGYSFYVKDEGKGMPQEEVEKITEAFYMIDKSRARRQGGAGLGLSICAEIVNRHQGRLEFESIEDKGTIVRVSLPKEAVG